MCIVTQYTYQYKKMSTYLLHFLFGVFDELVALGHRFVERLVLGLVEFNLNEMEGEIQHDST